MYSSSCSRAKFGLEGRQPMRRSRGKSCGYYMRIVFFFSSLIQSLIIVSLVLFLIYGQPEKSAEEKMVKELQFNFNMLSEKNIKLRNETTFIRAQLGARTAEKAALVKELGKLKSEHNITVSKLNLQILRCETVKREVLAQSSVAAARSSAVQQPFLGLGSDIKTLQTLSTAQKAMIRLIESNFTKMVNELSQQRDDAIKERDAHHQDGIALRKENTLLKDRLTAYTRKCKEDFVQPLEGIKAVTSSFLAKINNLFPHQMTFHLTCDSQQEQMEKIRNRCTNLSRDMENKFQIYLDNVGNKVAEIQSQSTRLEVYNTRMTSDLQECELRYNHMVADSSKKLQDKQQTHDTEMEKLLKEKNVLRGEKALQELQIQSLKGELQTLTARPNCKPGLPSSQQVGR